MKKTLIMMLTVTLSIFTAFADAKFSCKVPTPNGYVALQENRWYCISRQDNQYVNLSFETVNGQTAIVAKRVGNSNANATSYTAEELVSFFENLRSDQNIDTILRFNRLSCKKGAFLVCENTYAQIAEIARQNASKKIALNK